jgi:V/A-type H+-transporting ATPase subunit C
MARLDHVNARVGGRRSRLLRGDELRELLLRPGLAARIELLERSGRLGLEPLREVALATVEARLRQGIREDEARLLGEVEGRSARRLLAAALGIEEAKALKVLVRGTSAGIPPERLVELAPPTDGLPEPRLRELARAPSPEALVGLLDAAASPYAEPMRAALLSRARTGLVPVEVAIDRVAYGRVEEAAMRGGEDARILGDWLAELADGRNALTLLAMGDAVPGADLFLPGGRRLGAALFARLARGSGEARRSAAAALVPCEPGRLVDPASADRLLARSLLRRITLAARRAPLSLAVPLAWIGARREEVRRIGVVLRGAELGLAGDVLLDLAEA